MYVDKDYDKTAEGYFDPSIEVRIELYRNGQKWTTRYSCQCDDCTPEAIEDGFNTAKEDITRRSELFARARNLPRGMYDLDVLYELHDPYGDEYLDSDQDGSFYWNGEHFGFMEGLFR